MLRAMQTIVRYSRLAAAGLALLLSPAVVALGVPFAYGIASDILAQRRLAPVVTALAAAIALNAWRRRGWSMPLRRNRSPDVPAPPISAGQSPR